MPNVFRWSLGILLTIIMAFVTGMSPVTASDNQDESNWPTGCVAADSSTPGEDGYTAPAPCKIDASGTDQDQYCIPLDAFNHPTYGFGMYKVGDNAKGQACYSTKGNTSILVTTDFDSGTWTFKYSVEQSGVEAANVYRITVGKYCKRSSFTGDRYRRVWIRVTNVADDTGRSFSVYPDVEQVRDWYNISDTEVASSIPDSDTAVMRSREDVSNGILGLRPGKYKVTFWLSSSDWADVNQDYVGKRAVLSVPRCRGRRQ